MGGGVLAWRQLTCSLAECLASSARARARGARSSLLVSMTQALPWLVPGGPGWLGSPSPCRWPCGCGFGQALGAQIAATVASDLRACRLLKPVPEGLMGSAGGLDASHGLRRPCWRLQRVGPIGRCNDATVHVQSARTMSRMPMGQGAEAGHLEGHMALVHDGHDAELRCACGRWCSTHAAVVWPCLSCSCRA